MKKILLTGSEGLIGTNLRPLLENNQYKVIGYDLKACSHEQGDINDSTKINNIIQKVDGIIHLAGVSRVIDGEKNPDKCKKTNIGGTQNIVEVAINSPKKPFIIFSSSREVYGEPESFPVKEIDKLAPLNIYAESKVECEKIILKAREKGLNTSIVRLSNVYGDPNDHKTRVIPAFCRAGVTGDPIRVEGGENMFDFTHVDDTVYGIYLMVEKMINNDIIPPLHLLTGKGTSLNQLVSIIKKYSVQKFKIEYKYPRKFDVSRFYGSPSNAEKILGWKSKISIEEGVKKLIEDFQELLIEA